MGVMGVQSIIPVQQIQLRPNGNRPATPAGLVNAFALSTTARCLVPEPVNILIVLNKVST